MELDAAVPGAAAPNTEGLDAVGPRPAASATQFVNRVHCEERYLNCLFVNARSIMNNFKIEELQLYAHDWSLDIIGIAETWTHEDITDSEIKLDGFTMYRKDRSSSTRGGGVILYVNESLSSNVCFEAYCKNCEAVFCKILPIKGREIVIGVCYKSPSALLVEVNSLFDVVKEASMHNAVIMGDFNYPGINWDSYDSDAHGLDFLHFIQDCFLHQHVNTATHGSNILDLVFSTEEGIVEEVRVEEPLANSDHCIITWKTCFHSDVKASKQVSRDFYKADYVVINNKILSIDWDSTFEDSTTEDMWGKFTQILKEIIESNVPKKFSRKRKFPRWMTKDTKKLRKSKINLWKKFKATGDYNDLMEYKHVLNATTREYRKARNQFEHKLVSNIKCDSKSFYAYVRSKSQTRDTIGPLRNNLGHLITDDKGMCNLLNEYFASVFNDEDGTDVLPVVERIFVGDQNNKLLDIDITYESVLKCLEHLKENKAPGDDGFASTLFIKTAKSIAVPLCKIFQSSITSGDVPLQWRQSNVTAIYKSSGRSEPGNYRPISLTSIACKVVETLVKQQIVSHLQTNKLVRDSQHGFVSRRSCLTNLLTFLDFVHGSIDRGQPVDVVYLDFRKAFDKVPHRRLLAKVKAHGIESKVLHWISAWLTEREQRVVINGLNSDWTKVLSGVPQGSVLGPLLFVIYINDIDSTLLNKLLKFADDSKLYGTVRNQEEVANFATDLETLCKWSKDWMMPFNVEKCKVLHFGKHNPMHVHSINNVALKNVTEEIDLGVIVQGNLKVSEQCTKVVKAANRTLGMIKRTFSSRDSSIIVPLYKTLVRPQLEYCAQAWRPHLIKDITLLERVQQRALRMITGLNNLSYEQRLAKLDMTTLETRRLRGDMIEVYKIVKGFDDVEAQSFFEMSFTSLRGHSFKLYKKHVNTNTGKFSFTNRIVNTWNLLPVNVVSCSTVDSFKHKLDHYFKHVMSYT